LASRNREDEDRRRAPRYPVEGVEGTLKLLTKAEILNISVTGMAARTSTHLRVGQTCDLRLEHGGRNLRLPGTVVRAQLASFGKTGPVYEIGFEFQDMLSGQARDLLALLGETAVVSLDSRVAGRFKLDRAAPASLGASAGLVVRKISTSGALVETGVGPEPDQELDLNLELGTAPFACRARVAYVEPRKGEGEAEASAETVLVGMEFLKLGGAARRTLEAFIAERLG